MNASNQEQVDFGIRITIEGEVSLLPSRDTDLPTAEILAADGSRFYVLRARPEVVLAKGTNHLRRAFFQFIAEASK